jgi:hypothetical protein
VLELPSRGSVNFYARGIFNLNRLLY